MNPKAHSLIFPGIDFRYSALLCFEASEAMQKQANAFRGRSVSLLVASSCGFSPGQRFSRWSRRPPLQSINQVNILTDAIEGVLGSY